MKTYLKALFVILYLITTPSSCTKLESDIDDNSLNSMPTKVQHYADPTKFNKTGTGLVVASLTINGQNYSPKLFIEFK